MKLRAPNLSDIDLMFEWENDPLVQCHSSEPRNYSRDEIKNFITRQDNLITNGQQRWIILDNNDNTVGCVDLYDFCEGSQIAYVGILIYKNRREGLAMGAMELLHTYVRSVYHLRELRAEIPAKNSAAIRLFEKLGYALIDNDIFSITL